MAMDNLAESKFKEWLERHKIPFMYIQQDSDTFASVFKDVGKRPDFMILLPNFGLILVDIKDKDINTQYKTYCIDEKETMKYSSLQRKFNLHIWYVLSNSTIDYKTWFWIPVSKVLESGIKTHKAGGSGEGFFPIPTDEFIQIAHNDSISRLFEKGL